MPTPKKRAIRKAKKGQRVRQVAAIPFRIGETGERRGVAQVDQIPGQHAGRRAVRPHRGRELDVGQGRGRAAAAGRRHDRDRVHLAHGVEGQAAGR